MTQLSLSTEMVELTLEEKVARGWQLAQLVREARAMDEEHKERRAAMKEEREELEERIAHLADVVRSGKEERLIAR